MGSRADAANPMTKIDAIIAERDAEIAALKAELAECQIKSGMWEHSYEEALKDVSYMEADIKELKEQVVKLRIHNWPLVARVAALSAKLSDSQSDVETLLTTVSQQRQYIESLKSQVAELRAWKDAVPVVGIKRLFRDAPYDASYADEVWQWIEKYTLNR